MKKYILKFRQAIHEFDPNTGDPTELFHLNEQITLDEKQANDLLSLKGACIVDR